MAAGVDETLYLVAGPLERKGVAVTSSFEWFLGKRIRGHCIKTRYRPGRLAC
jgi:hypothetical protein